jgi:hypothetical protein
LLLATILVPPVGAFETGEAAWNTSAFPIPYWIDPRMATTTEGVISPEVVQQAFARWSDLPSSSFAAEYRGFRGGANQNPNECRIGLEYIPPGVFSPPLARTRTDIVGDGLVDWRDLFQLAREWRRTNNQFLELFRFDFGQKYYVGEIDLLLFLERWQENTLPNP